MIKRIFCGLLALLLLFSLVGCQEPSPDEPQEDGKDDASDAAFTAARALSSVVAVKCTYYTESGALYATSGGSGVIYRLDDRGGAYILTNYHVVHDACHVGEDAVCPHISVTTYGLEETEGLSATCLGTVGDYDVALLYVEDLVSLLPCARAVKLGRAPRLGEPVLAVGNALTRGLAVTRGVLGRTGEELSVRVPYRPTSITLHLLRHDAAISEGNSGGALFGEDGVFLGLVNARFSGEGALGINYAIPASTVLPLAEDLLRAAYADTWVFGALVEEERVSTDLSDGELTVKTRLRVGYVGAGTPASLFLSRGDLLLSVSVNGEEVTLPHAYALQELFLSLRAEDVLLWQYERDGKRESYSLTVSALQLERVS